MTQAILHTGFGLLFVSALLVAVVWDIATFEIPDTIPIVLAIGALTGAIVVQGSGGADIPQALLSHLLVGGVVFAGGVGLFCLGQWGGGDVKLLGATSLWFGWSDLPFYLSAVAIAGGGLTLIVLGMRCISWPESWRNMPWFARLLHPDEGVPYGVALGLGGLLSLDRALTMVTFSSSAG
jgi:prepilin peptidase CpaA